MVLDGVVVADFSRVLAGPLATMLLADLGAEVVKIERPGGGDDTRQWRPPAGPDGQASYFLAVNRNKRSAALDLDDPEDLRVAEALVARADVVVENFRPGVMDRLGLGYETTAARNPRVVFCSISGFGAGAGRDLPGYDLLVQARGGLMSITGEPDGDPQKVGVALVDVLCGLFATIGVLAALRDRDRTGRGQHVEIDLLSSVLAGLVNQASAWLNAGEVPARLGNRHPSIAPYEPLRTGDGRVVVAVGNDRQFAALCETLGIAQAAADERFANNEARVAHRDALRALLEERLAAAPAATWTERLLAAGVPAGEISSIDEAFALAEQLGLQPVLEHQGDATRSVRNPLRLSGQPLDRREPPPALGADTEHVRRAVRRDGSLWQALRG